VDQPMMRAVLADLALEVEAATALVMRLCRSFDLADGDPREAARARLLTPAVKYWVCKSAPGFIYEAMECLGGNGDVEESTVPRLYREAPVNAIWEGSGNVMCLDVLRAFDRDAEAAQAVLQDLGKEAAGLPGAREIVERLRAALAAKEAEADARDAAGGLAWLAAAAALRATAPAVAEQFARTRLANRQGTIYGTASIQPDETRRLLERALL